MAFLHGYITINVDLVPICGKSVQNCIRYASVVRLFMLSFDRDLRALDIGFLLFVSSIAELIFLWTSDFSQNDIENYD